jgi:hypothetical protein
MTDRDVQREIEANEARANRRDRDDNDGGIVDAAEELISPVVDTIRRGDEADDVDTVEDRVRENDAEQRPN